MSFHYSANRFDFCVVIFIFFPTPFILCRNSRNKFLKLSWMLAFVVPTYCVSCSDKAGFVPTFWGNSVFSVSLFALFLAIPVSIQSENAARNYPVAALPGANRINILGDCTFHKNQNGTREAALPVDKNP